MNSLCFKTRMSFKRDKTLLIIHFSALKPNASELLNLKNGLANSQSGSANGRLANWRYRQSLLLRTILIDGLPMAL